MYNNDVIDKISITMQAINLMYSIMNKIKPSLAELEEINKRHELLIDQEKFWSKDIALNFGSLLKVWQGKFNLKRRVRILLFNEWTAIRKTLFFTKSCCNYGICYF